MKPVWDLNDEEELEHECHEDMRVSIPQASNMEQIFPEQDVSSPNNTDQIECQKLSTFIEFGVLDLGQMKLAVHFIQKILLDDLVHDNSNEEIEEDGRDVL